MLIWIQTQIHVPYDPANTTDRTLSPDPAGTRVKCLYRVATAALSVILERRGHAEVQPGARYCQHTDDNAEGLLHYCGQASTSSQRASRNVQSGAVSMLPPCQPPHKAQRSLWNGDSFLTKSPFIQL